MRRPRNKVPASMIVKNDSYEADPLCIKLQKIMEGKGSIDETAPIIYTEKRNGVLPDYNIRTDRFEVAREAKEKIRDIIAKRESAGSVPKEEPKSQGESEKSSDGAAV